MKIIIRTLALIGFAAVAGNLLAADAAIRGIVRDANGKPLGGANVRIEARGGSGSQQNLKTDGRGQYAYNRLQAGATYRVSLLVNSVVQASINNVTATAGNPTELNFDMKKASAAAAPTKKKHMVFIPSETGSNLGGRWVEADAGDTAAPSANNVKRVGAGAVATMTSNGGRASGGN
jgi:hypothetical protein